MGKMNLGRMLRHSIARLFGRTVQNVSNNKVVSKVSNKVKFVCLTSILNAYQKTRGKKLEGTLRLFALIFDTALLPIEIVWNSIVWCNKFYQSRWAGTAPVKGLPYAPK